MTIRAGPPAGDGGGAGAVGGGGGGADLRAGGAGTPGQRPAAGRLDHFFCTLVTPGLRGG